MPDQGRKEGVALSTCLNRTRFDSVLSHLTAMGKEAENLLRLHEQLRFVPAQVVCEQLIVTVQI